MNGERSSHRNTSEKCSTYQIDNLFGIKENISYLYPSNGIIVKVLSQTSQNIGNGTINLIEIRTSVITNDNHFSFASNQQAKKGGYFTAKFDDGSVFSINTKGESTQIQFSDDKLYHYTFCDDGNIHRHDFKTENEGSAKNAYQEIKRIYKQTVYLY
jgi:hypothetical protein